MAVLTIIYSDGVETHRWAHLSLASVPKPENHPFGAVMAQRLNNEPPRWAVNQQHGRWLTLKEASVPKVYQLLYLLE